MRTLKALFLAAVAGAAFCTTAFAEESWADNSGAKAAAADNAAAADSTAATTDSYGRTPCQIAVNQGIVAYWYAHAYANLTGDYPKKLSDLATVGLNLRKWVGPATGQDIDPDDGKLDFLGDFTYTYDCWDPSIKVSTVAGEVTVPSTMSGGSECNPRCCEVQICGHECWNFCGNEVVCQTVQWILWKSFKLYYCMYECCPADEMEWMASGLAPYDKNVKELAPFMDVCYFYKACCLVKAKVRCCKPCNSCPETKCGSCNKCGYTKNCGSCNKCESKCGSKCGGCNKCAKPSCNKCGESKCGGKCGDSKCGSCNKCAKPACGKCESKCGSCKSSCNSCDKCKSGTSCGSCNKCASKSSSCDKCAKPSCNSCAKKTCGSCSKSAGKCNSCAKPNCGGCNKCGG